MFDPTCFLLPWAATLSLGGGVRVHTTEDAIALLPPSFDRLIPLGDVDGDGSPEIAQRSFVDFHARFDVVSVRDGRVVRVLWDPGMRSATAHCGRLVLVTIGEWASAEDQIARRTTV